MEKDIQTMGEKSHIKYGCVIFDDVNDHTSGYASVAGQEAIRIKGTEDLPSDIVWITNLQYNIIGFAGLSNSTRFKQSGFLRARIDQLMAPLRIVDPIMTSEIMALLMRNTMQITEHFFDCNNINPGRELKRIIRKKIKEPDQLLDEHVITVIKDATSHYSPVERPVQQNPSGQWDHAVFQIHPFKIAEATLPLAYPYGKEFRTIYTQDLPKGIQSLAQMESLFGGPFFAKIRLTEIDSDLNPILNFGGGPSCQEARREWVSSYELGTLLKIANVEIKEVLIPEKTDTIYKPFFEKLCQLDPATHMSLSFMTFIENLWCAGTVTLYPPNQKNVGGMSKNFMNQAMPFIKAVERNISMQAAIKIIEAGFDVSGYGSGRIRVNLRGESPEEILSAAVMSDTIPPIPHNPSEFDTESILGTVNTPMKVLQSLYIKGDTQKIIGIDNQIIERLLS